MYDRGEITTNSGSTSEEDSTHSTSITHQLVIWVMYNITALVNGSTNTSNATIPVNAGDVIFGSVIISIILAVTWCEKQYKTVKIRIIANNKVTQRQTNE